MVKLKNKQKFLGVVKTTDCIIQKWKSSQCFETNKNFQSTLLAFLEDEGWITGKRVVFEKLIYKIMVR